MRIMILSSRPGIGTAYSNICQNLSMQFKKLNHDVAITGIQSTYMMEDYRGIPVYPLMDDFHQAGDINSQINRLVLNMKHHQTEALLCIFQADSFYGPFTRVHPKTVWYTPIEGEIVYTNQPTFKETRGVKKIIAMTHAAGEQFTKQKIDNTVIYPGYDPNIFTKNYSKHIKDEITIYFPINNEELVLPAVKLPELKQHLGIDFILGFVAQNFGIKKRFERLIEAFSIFAQNKKNVHLHLHCMPVSAKGIDLFQIMDRFKIRDKITFSYGTVGSSGLSEKSLNILYNIFDIYVSASSGEGFGMPILESMAVGIPQIHPDFLPFQELLGYDNEKRGLLAKCIRQLTVAGEERALVDIQSLVEKMEFFYAWPDFREYCAANATKWASLYTWMKCAQEFDKVFRSM